MSLCSCYFFNEYFCLSGVGVLCFFVGLSTSINPFCFNGYGVGFFSIFMLSLVNLYVLATFFFASNSFSTFLLSELF
jgi:hypothetical protein